MNQETIPPFDGETESDAVPDNAAPTTPNTSLTDSGTDSETPPPMNSPARGPMEQTVPDVATGSTPLTRHDD